jgi:hypothetical protein
MAAPSRGEGGRGDRRNGQGLDQAVEGIGGVFKKSYRERTVTTSAGSV